MATDLFLYHVQHMGQDVHNGFAPTVKKSVRNPVHTGRRTPKKIRRPQGGRRGQQHYPKARPPRAEPKEANHTGPGNTQDQRNYHSHPCPSLQPKPTIHRHTTTTHQRSFRSPSTHHHRKRLRPPTTPQQPLATYQHTTTTANTNHTTPRATKSRSRDHCPTNLHH